MTEPISPSRLAVHDTSPIVDGSTARQSLQNSLELAQLADELGFARYWAAELHGMRGVASCAPAVLAALVASTTQRIRVGAGGVLLPYHSPLVISEQFGTLEAVHPGRIDLAVGRGAGGPRAAQLAVRADTDATTAGFAEQVRLLRSYFAQELTDKVRSVPGFGNEPQLWMLGGSEDSAQLAAALGLPYAFGGFYNQDDTAGAAETYRMAFSSADGKAPYLAAWVGVIAADTDEEAEFLASSYRLKSVASRLWGRKMKLPDPHVAQEHKPTDKNELRHFHRATDGFIIGSKERVRFELAEFLSRTGADELILRMPIYDHESKLRSMKLLTSEAR